MDIKFSFFHGDLQEEMYMEKPLGYIQNEPTLVYHFNNSLYVIK